MQSEGDPHLVYTPHMIVFQLIQSAMMRNCMKLAHIISKHTCVYKCVGAPRHALISQSWLSLQQKFCILYHFF